MSKLREAVSRVRATHKLLSGDSSINDRTIAAELKGNAITLIRQYTNKRLLWATDTIFTAIPCLEMVPVPISECCGNVSNKMVARSRYKLPTISEGDYQYLIQGVFDINLSRSIKYTSIQRYINILKLGLPSEDVYFWIHDNYVWVSSEFVTDLKFIAFFEGDLPFEVLHRDCSCTEGVKPDPCTNPLDETFKCPGFLETSVITMTSQSLLQTYFKIPKDHTSDNKDDQVNKV